MCNVIFQGCMSITQQAFALHNSYLVLICDAKTLSPKKDEELFWTLDWLLALIWRLTLYKRYMGVWKLTSKGVGFTLGPQKKRINCFGHWTVSMCWSGVWLCTRDGRLKTDPLTRVGVTLYNSFLVLICDAKTWSPQKREKLFWILDCLYALIRYLTLYKRWELKTDPLTRVGVTLYNSSLVLICDAKTWSPKKRKKLFRILDCLYALIRCLTLYKRWET